MKKIAFNIIVILVSAVAFGQKDVAFAIETAKSNMLEIKLGEMASQKGMSDKVKLLGKSMLDEHSKINTELLEVANQKKLALPTSLQEKEQRIYDKLAAKEAESFDKAYCKFTAKSHKKIASRFRKEAKRGKDQQLKKLAYDNVNELEQQLITARETCNEIKKK